ncbi:MAG: hypothetical protein CL910_12085 [Deltaproteobacteria bacterium]|jgi:hypothetical protein|nr:hypothetical protein [Deltaproteobacteria bacterium]
MREIAILVLALLLAPSLACNRVETTPQAAAASTPAGAPDQALRLQLSLDDRFRPARREGKAIVMRLPDLPDVELWLVVGRDPVSGPVPGRAALVQKALAFLEPIHGEVQVSTTEQGDDLLAFDGPKPDGNRTLHSYNWMLIRPGADSILRADLSLRMPDRWVAEPAMKGLVEHVSERLATASFEPGA